MTRGVVLAAILAVLAPAGCSKEETPKPQTAASADAPRPSAAPPAPSAAEKKPTAWFVGAWSGSYEAQHYLVEAPKNEGAREWAADDGGAHSGEGALSLTVAESRQIKGTADGPLGRHTLSGEVDGDTFRVRFSPERPGERTFAGFAILTRKGDVLEGRLQASTGDSRTVRDATISLRHGSAAGQAGAPAATSPSAPSGSAAAAAEAPSVAPAESTP